MKLLIKIVLLFLLFICCNDNQIYRKLMIKNPELITRLKLEEDDSILITSIKSISLNTSANRILLSDLGTGKIYLFDFIKGKAIKTFSAYLNLSDSLALKSKPIYDSSYYLTKNDFFKETKNHFGEDYLKEMIHNIYCNGIFKSDSEIVLNGLIYVIIYNKLIQPENRLGLEVTYAINNINLNTNNSNINKYDNKMAAPRIYSLLFDKRNNQVIIDCGNYIGVKNKKFNQLISLAYYSLDGKFIKPICPIPKIMIESGLMYSFVEPNIMFNSNFDLICTFPLVEKICNISKNSFFELSNLPVSNKDIFNRLKNDTSLIRKFGSDLANQFPLKIDNIMLTEKNNYLVNVHLLSINQKNKDSIRNIIQEYNPKGELLKQIELDIHDEYGKIDRIFYSIPHKALLFFRKSSKLGWFVEFRRWYK
jgi:hypothetical protein